MGGGRIWPNRGRDAVKARQSVVQRFCGPQTQKRNTQQRLILGEAVQKCGSAGQSRPVLVPGSKTAGCGGFRPEKRNERVMSNVQRVRAQYAFGLSSESTHARE